MHIHSNNYSAKSADLQACMHGYKKEIACLVRILVKQNLSSG